MAKMSSIRILLSLVVHLDWSLHQFVVKNTFLHWNLEEEAYMDLPAGFEDFSDNKKAFRLKKLLYRLKQSPKAWFVRLRKSLKKYGFVKSQGNHTLFIKHSSFKKIIILIIYVSDIIVTVDDVEEIESVKIFQQRSSK